MGKALLPVYVLFDNLKREAAAIDYEVELRRSLVDMEQQIEKQIKPSTDIELNYTLMRMQLFGHPNPASNPSLSFVVDIKSALSRIFFDCESKSSKYSLVSPYVLILFTKHPPESVDWKGGKETVWDKLSKTFEAEIEFRASESLRKLKNFDLRLPVASKNLDLNSLSMLFSPIGMQSQLNQKIKKIASKLPYVSLPSSSPQPKHGGVISPPPPPRTGPLPSPAPSLPMNKQPAAKTENSAQNNQPVDSSAIQPIQKPVAQPAFEPQKEEIPAPKPPEFKPAPPAEWQVNEPPAKLGDRSAHTRVDNRNAGEWYICGASRRGKLHENEATFREDEFAIDYATDWILVAVADGAGSHHLSRIGSKLAVNTALNVMRSTVEHEPPSKSTARAALQDALRESWKALFQDSERRKVEFRDLSTTLLLLMYHPKKNLVGVAQIGDGLIAAQLQDGRIALLGNPESGEYSGQTYFLTNHKPDDLPSKCETPEAPGPIKYFFVMTDGVADDLYPPKERLPGLIKAIPSVMVELKPEEALLELINYNRPGSFDDRTIVVVCKRQEIIKEASAQAQPKSEPLSSDSSQPSDQENAAKVAEEAKPAESSNVSNETAGKITSEEQVPLETSDKISENKPQADQTPNATAPDAAQTVSSE
jgi:hypothetical protein